MADTSNHSSVLVVRKVTKPITGYSPLPLYSLLNLHLKIYFYISHYIKYYEKYDRGNSNSCRTGIISKCVKNKKRKDPSKN